MKPVSPPLHGAIDYLAVLIFAAAPTLIGLMGWPALLCYALAFIHLLMTVLTDFPAGAVKMVPVVLHNWVERLVGPALVLIGALPLPGGAPNARIFFAAMGLVIFPVG